MLDLEFSQGRALAQALSRRLPTAAGPGSTSDEFMWVFPAVTMKNSIAWNVAPCNFLGTTWYYSPEVRTLHNLADVFNIVTSELQNLLENVRRKKPDIQCLKMRVRIH
jgi:hypothetical protein